MTQYYKKNDDGEFVEAELDKEDINEAVMRRIDRINAKYADYDELKKQVSDSEEKQKTLEDQIKTLSEERDTLSKEVSTAKLAADKVKIMSEFGIKDELADFIDGASVDEMRERAEKLSRNTNQSVSLKKADKDEEEVSQEVQLARSLFGTKE